MKGLDAKTAILKLSAPMSAVTQHFLSTHPVFILSVFAYEPIRMEDGMRNTHCAFDSDKTLWWKIIKVAEHT